MLFAVGVPGWPIAFRGSQAVAAGLVTKARLRGPQFVRLFPDVYVRAADEQTLELRSLAAFRLLAGKGGVVSGYSAAELHGASCVRGNAPAEVTVPGGGVRGHPGLVLHRDALLVDDDHAEIVRFGDVRLTGELRTAYDLARWATDRTEAVVAVDALARVGGFDPDLLLNMILRHPGARGSDRLYEVMALAERRSGSPMETRLRLLLVDAGLPRPVAQHPVQYSDMRQAVWLDLAYPEKQIGIEYEGAEHTTRDGVLRDVGRYTQLVDRRWRIYRYSKREVYGDRARIVRQIGRALAD